MKNVTTILLLLIIATTTFSQQAPPVEKDYWKKSKNQKKTARITLGGGMALLATGIIIPKGVPINPDPSGPDNHIEFKNDGPKGTLNKKKPATISLKNEPVSNSLAHGSIPSLN